MTGAENFCILTEIDFEAVVKNVQRSFPQSAVLELFAVSHDSAVKLIHLIKSAILHQQRQHLATNSTSAIGDDWAIFEMVVDATLKDLEEPWRGINRWHDGVAEFADSCFVLIASIKEHDLVTSLSNKFIDL